MLQRVAPLKPVPRVRPPTFAEPPPLLSRIILSEHLVIPAVADRFPRFEVNLLDQDQGTGEDLGQLAFAVWYALWDVFGSASFRANSQVLISFKNLHLPVQKLKKLMEDLFPGGHSHDVVRVSRAGWYSRYPIFCYPTLTHEQFKSFSSNRHPTSVGSLVSGVHQQELPPPPETLYERYVDHLRTYICLSIYGNSQADVVQLHQWLNDPRVDEFWKDSGTLERHVRWLKERYDDSHVLPILASYRDINHHGVAVVEPFGYFEIYRAADDKIAQVYTAHPHDQGIHMLVGSNAHRGPHRVRSWLPSLVHYIFASEPRTQRILSEPDHRNLKMIRYLESVGFVKVKEASMGHKVAAIMVLERAHFWKLCPL